MDSCAGCVTSKTAGFGAGPVKVSMISARPPPSAVVCMDSSRLSAACAQTATAASNHMARVNPVRRQALADKDRLITVFPLRLLTAGLLRKRDAGRVAHVTATAIGDNFG